MIVAADALAHTDAWLSPATGLTTKLLVIFAKFHWLWIDDLNTISFSYIKTTAKYRSAHKVDVVVMLSLRKRI